MTESNTPWTIAVVTGTRADFGLLRPVMRAIAASPALRLQTIITGTHLLPDLNTRSEVAAEFDIAAELPMQQPGETGRIADAIALGRGITGLAETFAELHPDVVLVLGDRIEAFAAASAASVAGILVAHIHGGDRAEGVADEAMRHASTKLAHIHFPATQQSAERIRRMGEREDSIHLVGSPAIDDLASFEPLTDDQLRTLGIDPVRDFTVVLHHPTGLDDATEYDTMSAILAATESAFEGNFVIGTPNHDPGREAVIRAIGDRPMLPHLPRKQFIGLLKRAKLLIGNSSAGLIEAAALGVSVVNVGPRQAGRERASNAIDAAEATQSRIALAVQQARLHHPAANHPYGNGQSGQRIAARFEQFQGSPPSPRKHNQY